MSQALRKLAGAISKSNCVAIFINQLREKVGVVYGNPEVTPGGRALKYYSSVRIEVRKVETIKNGSEILGSKTRAKVVKNKIAPPFKEAIFDIMYGKGISRTGELLDLAVEKDIIHKSGAWFSYGEERLGQGRDNIKNLLAENKELAAEIEEKVLATLAEERENSKKKTSKGKNEKVIEESRAVEEIQPAVDTKDIDIMVED